ncbi:hypothetical protein [Roseimaritima ulvae]|uniref:Carboxypeptidase regulatory-like domain-containing protein n=1 Tax=Roseimaritima ulvae TaxID=980254 RepID=A0A5B9R208_9BACT|nr:hypothetical protein [Roseimaritima ulvae]QEG43466.1 hypothetical protein UC8_55160 [Roseimaritima ulvae]
MRNWNCLSALLGLAVAAAVVGCGPSRPAVVPVSGQVLIDGEPLKNASIMVAPSAGKAAFGRSDDEGRFTLTTYEPDDGCMTGTHPVEVSATEPESASVMLVHTPLKYMDVDTSDLSVTIEEATDDLRIELSWDGQKGPIRQQVAGE